MRILYLYKDTATAVWIVLDHDPHRTVNDWLRNHGNQAKSGRKWYRVEIKMLIVHTLRNWFRSFVIITGHESWTTVLIGQTAAEAKERLKREVPNWIRY